MTPKFVRRRSVPIESENDQGRPLCPKTRYSIGLRRLGCASCVFSVQWASVPNETNYIRWLHLRRKNGDNPLIRRQSCAFVTFAGETGSLSPLCRRRSPPQRTCYSRADPRRRDVMTSKVGCCSGWKTHFPGPARGRQPPGRGFRLAGAVRISSLTDVAPGGTT